MRELYFCLIFTAVFTICLAIISCGTSGKKKFDCIETKMTITDKETSGGLDKEFTVTYSTFVSNSPQSKTVVIMPPTGGRNFIDSRYAKNFCASGINAIIIEDWTNLNERAQDLEFHKRFYARGQRAIDLVTSTITTKFVGILGTSVGAIHASVAISRNPQLSAAFIIVGGTTIASVVADSDQQAMVELKYARFKKFNFASQQEYKDAIYAVIDLEPLKLKFDRKNKTLGMVISKNDTTVPTADQIKLFEYWQPEKVIYINSEHTTTVVRTWLSHSDEVLEFFENASNNNPADKKTDVVSALNSPAQFGRF